MRRFKNALLALLVLMFASVPSMASTPSACHLLNSSTALPAGFGAAYDLFSQGKEVTLKVQCGPDPRATFNVGNGRASLHIFKTAYEWTGSTWRAVPLSGPKRTGDWYIGSAAAEIVRSEAELAEENFLTAYTCFRSGSQWKCGCRNTSCSRSYWQLQAFKYAPPPEEDDGSQEAPDGTAIPAPIRTVNVSSAAQLSSALSNAQPGDHIVLQNGTYSGFTVSRSGQNGKPLVIRAATTLGARVNGDIWISGDHAWVIGMDVTGGGSVAIGGTGDRISSSRFRSQGPSIMLSSGSRSATVDHNEIESQSKGTEVGWYGIRIVYKDNGYKHHVYRNYLHGAPSNTDGGDDNTAIGIGVNANDWAYNGQSVVEYNLIENWYGDDEIIMIKSSDNIVRFNTLIGGREFDTRVGNNNKWIANWLENAKRIRIHGRDGVVIGNRAPEIRIYAGDGDVFGDAVRYVTAVNTVVAGNTGPLVVGATISGRPNHPARNTQVGAHNGSIATLSEVNTTVSDTTNHSIPQAFKLTPAQVGPFAPTAPTL